MLSGNIHIKPWKCITELKYNYKIKDTPELE